MISWILVPVLVLAQTNWDAVRALKANTKIRIERRNAEAVTGRLGTVSEGTLELRRGRNSETIDRGEIRRVSRRVSRAKHVVRGAAIGAGGGAATAGIAIATVRPDFSWSAITAGFAILGAAIGAGVGACVPRHQKVYESP